MSDKKNEILDGFHNATTQLSYADLAHQKGITGWAISHLQRAKDYIDKLIQEIEEE